MHRKKSRIIYTSRLGSQITFTIIFFVLLVGMTSGAISPTVGNLFFYTDPLVLVTDALTTWTLQTILLAALIPVALTLLLGKFYCGWVCPMGAINHFFSWLAIRFGRLNDGLSVGMLRFKYVVLVLVLVPVFFGSRVGMVFDPTSLLTRSASTAVIPFADNLVVEDGAATRVVRVQAGLIGGLFLAVILLNFYRRRFYCNGLCPLGALYGLLARISPLNFVADESCTDCGMCAQFCTYGGNPSDAYSKNDCSVCFNCARECPVECVDVAFGRPAPGALVPTDLGRRKFLGAAAAGIFLSALPGLSPAAGEKSRGFMRPPGSLAEEDFLRRCIRCGACVQSCPTSFVQFAGTEAGIDGVWTPVVNATAGYCDYECTACAGVCPTGAIEMLPLEAKKEFRIGVAVVDKSKCFTYADGFNCTICADRCPTPRKAIRFRETKSWNFRGEVASVNQIYVDPDLCNGCGACEFACPRSDAPGIFVCADNEQREYRM